MFPTSCLPPPAQTPTRPKSCYHPAQLPLHFIWPALWQLHNTACCAPHFPVKTWQARRTPVVEGKVERGAEEFDSKPLAECSPRRFIRDTCTNQCAIQYKGCINNLQKITNAPSERHSPDLFRRLGVCKRGQNIRNSCQYDAMQFPATAIQW